MLSTHDLKQRVMVEISINNERFVLGNPAVHNHFKDGIVIVAPHLNNNEIYIAATSIARIKMYLETNLPECVFSVIM